MTNRRNQLQRDPVAARPITDTHLDMQDRVPYLIPALKISIQERWFRFFDTDKIPQAGYSLPIRPDLSRRGPQVSSHHP